MQKQKDVDSYQQWLESTRRLLSDPFDPLQPPGPLSRQEMDELKRATAHQEALAASTTKLATVTVASLSGRQIRARHWIESLRSRLQRLRNRDGPDVSQLTAPVSGFGGQGAVAAKAGQIPLGATVTDEDADE